MRHSRLRGGVMIACLVASAAARADAPAPDDPKSAVLATSLSIGGTLAGATLLVTGLESGERDAALHDEIVPLLVSGSTLLVFGPSFGNWYAHQGSSIGLGLRL